MITIFTSHKFDYDKCPTNLKKNLDSWKSLNTSFNFKYYNDVELNSWMKQNVDSDTFNYFVSLNSGAGKADLFRICHLYYSGGIWVDADLPAFDILKQKSDFIECLNENKAIIVRNRKCDNPRYTFIASIINNRFFNELKKLINKHIEFAMKTNKIITTIHITGPFVLHKLIKIKYNLKEINLLELNKKYIFNDDSFIYINDIVPEKATYVEENTYPGYLQDLQTMGVTPHNRISSVKK